MITRKEQMQKIQRISDKVDNISIEVKKTIDNYLIEHLAEIVKFNHCMVFALNRVLKDEQQKEFIDALDEEMSRTESED